MDRKKRLPNYNNENDRKLIRLFSDTMQDIRALYFEAINEWNKTKAMKLMRQLNQISKALNDEYGKWSKYELTKEYVKWAYYINDTVKEWTVYLWVNKVSQEELNEMLKEMWVVHVQAVKALIDTSDMYVKASLDWMERVAIQSLSKLHQEMVREELAKWILKGESMQEMKNGISDLLHAENITKFQDRAWRYRNMDTYVEMLTRTETNIANTQGTINRAIQLWFTKFQIVELPDCCEVCAEMNGNIVDVTDWTVELPPFHPNCRWSINVVF